MYPYVTAFHNLGGNTIGEHRKNFNTYLSSLRSLPIDRLKRIMEALSPRTLQEEIFVTKIKIAFKYHEKLWEAFFKGNIIINKIIINKAFDDLVCTIDANTFTEKICPNISMVMRLKIINKLARLIDNPSVGNSFYQKILSRYGQKMASNLLVCCSEEVIKENLREFTYKQLIRLHKKYPTFLKFYLEKTRRRKVKKIAIYLSNNDVESYYENFKYFSEVNIGRKGFVNFINRYKNEVIKDPLKFFKIIRDRIIIRRFSSDDHIALVMNLFPDKINADNYYEDALKYTKKLPFDIRGDIFSKAFKEKFGCEVFTQKMNWKIISIFPSKYRLMWTLSETKHLPLFPTNNAIKKIKALINKTSGIMKKKMLFLQLLETCKINRDLDALLNVLKYIVKYHRNVPLTTKLGILSYLIRNFKIEYLSQRYWDCINLLLVSQSFPEIWKFSEYKAIIEKRVTFKLINGFYVMKDLKVLLKLRGDDLVRNRLKLNVSLEKEYIMKISQVVTLPSESLIFCQLIYDFNKRNKKYTINYFDYPTILKLLFDTLVIVGHPYTEQDIRLLFNILFMKGLKPEHDIIQKNFMKKYLDTIYYLPRRMCVWFLNNQPDFVAENLVRFVDSYRPYEIEMVRFSKIHQKIEQHYLESILINDDVAAINFLSYSVHFNELTNKYIPPPGCKINVNNAPMEKILNIQRFILGAIKYTPVPYKFLDIILNYAKGDYLKFALQPLYFAFCHIPEKQLCEPLIILAQRSESVRKHVISLTIKHLPLITTYNTLKRALETEKGIWARICIIRSCYNYFIINPTHESFNLLKYSLTNQNISQIRSVLYKFRNVNSKYLADYIKLLWNSSEEKPLSILRVIDSTIVNKLDNDFCEEILTKSLLNENVNAKDFICIYLLYAEEALQYRVTTLFHCIIEYIEKGEGFEKIMDTKSFIYLLLESICIFMVKEKSTITIRTMQESFKNITTPYSKFIYELLFDITVLFVENAANFCYKLFAKFLYDYCLVLINKYGDVIFNHFKEFLKNYLRKLFFTMDGVVARHYLLLAEEFLEMECGLWAQLLAVCLLPDEGALGPEEIFRYHILMNKLSELDSPIVVLFLEMRLKST